MASAAPYRIGYYLVPQFSMIAFASAVEPLRLANRVNGNSLYEFFNYSLDGHPVAASNGMTINVDGRLADQKGLSAIFVCGGLDVQRYAPRPLLTQLRRLAARGTNVGAMCTGTHILAKAGLLDGYRCTIHWENLNSFHEEFPRVDVTSELFEIDRNRFTCAGGTAAVDLMLNLIALQAGHSIAAAVADQLIHHRIRDGHERQRMGLRSRLGVSHPKLLAVLARMEEAIEAPADCRTLAAGVGLSSRQLERLFQKYLARSPSRYYLDLRLDRARFLLLQTALPILNIAIACGFVSAAHFSKCYRDRFSRSPSGERRQTPPRE